MKKTIIIAFVVLSLLLIFLGIVWTIKSGRVGKVIMPSTGEVPTVTQSVTIAPTDPFPTPYRTGIDGDYIPFQKLSEDEQEYGRLMLELPIVTKDSTLEFDFSNSTIRVEILTDKGMTEYQDIRNRYPNLDNSYFVITDKR